MFIGLDAKNGFWQLQLEKEPSMLIPFGRYRWLVMPFGLGPAPEIYQKRQKELLEGLKGFEVFADDTLVYGKGDTMEEAQEDHDKNPRKVLERVRENKMKLNRSKAKIGLENVTYYGHILSSEGLKADPAKVKAVLDMPVPKNVKDLQCMIGMATYLA